LESGLCTGIAVSKPLLGAVAIGVSAAGLAPAKTLQARTPVAPFQLAYTVAVAPLDLTAIAGGAAGVALQGKR
jgi:hypothetical protein